MQREEINAVLASAGIHPRHGFGQNFMVDAKVLQAVVDAGGINPEDVVLEVGPGVGNLTRELARRASRGAVLAVDIDRKLLPAAQRHHAELANVTWLLTDVLAGKHAIEPAVLAKLRELRQFHPHGQLKLVSNLPYNAASPVVAELLVEMWRELRGPESQPSLLFERLVFTVQWEVALRMNAAVDTRDYGPLGILIQATCPDGGHGPGVEIVRKIGAGAFWPAPKISSALVRLKPDVQAMRRLADLPRLQVLLSGVFSHRRQTLGNALKHFLADRWNDPLKQQLADAGFDLAKRPETFAVPEFLRLAELVES